jgi:hypothetical protein
MRNSNYRIWRAGSLSAYNGLGAVLAAAITLSACATHNQSPAQQPGNQTAAADPNHHIYVTSDGLAQSCYRDLGQITNNESFARSVTESDSDQEQRLRDLAREKYANNVDAVILVRKNQNDAGTEVAVTGEAVHLQNHQTVECTLREAPGVVDAASAIANGGIIGTLVGGLVGTGGSVYGAESGGAMGAVMAAGIQGVKYKQQQQEQEAEITSRIAQQQQQITELKQTLAKLVKQQCDAEELSDQDCDQRLTDMQKSIAASSAAGGAARASTPSSKQSSSAAQPTQFDVLNHIQEQQEIIDRLQQKIAQLKLSLSAK